MKASFTAKRRNSHFKREYSFIRHKNQNTLGDLVCNGVQDLAELADHVEFPGNLAIQGIGECGKQDDGCEQIASAGCARTGKMRPEIRTPVQCGMCLTGWGW